MPEQKGSYEEKDLLRSSNATNSDKDADLIIIPVPWDVTVSEGGGTSDAPQAILDKYSFLEEALIGLHKPWSLKSTILPIPKEIYNESEKFRDLALSHISSDGSGPEDDLRMIPKTINEVCEKLNIWVNNKASACFKEGKLVAVLGGDHSVALGLIRALSRKHRSFGILQIDAHPDLKNAADGFAYSNASVMLNALKLRSVSRLVQAGIRQVSSEELKVMESESNRIVTYYDEKIKNEQFRGIMWHDQCERIIEALPDLVYVSIDIDGLDPSMCPSTASPVPGGLSYSELTYLIELLVREGKRIIGFDICEVSPGETEWDIKVATRLLYFMSSWTGASNGLIPSSQN